MAEEDDPSGGGGPTQKNVDLAKELAGAMSDAASSVDEAGKSLTEAEMSAKSWLETSRKLAQQAVSDLETKLKIAQTEGDILRTATIAKDIKAKTLQFEIENKETLETRVKLDDDARRLRQLELESMQARNELIKKAISLTGQLGGKISSLSGETIKGTKGISDLLKQLADAKGEPGFFAGMTEQMKGANRVAIAQGVIGTGLLAIGKLSFDQTIKQAFALDKVNAAFTAQTGIIGPLRDQIGTLYQQNLALGMSMEDVSKSTGALAGGFSEFVALNPNVQRAVTEQTVLLEKIGVSSATSAKMMNELTKSMGMTTGEAMATTRSITSLGIQLGIPGDVINQKFVAALPKLRVYGDRAVEVFRDLAIAARETGTSVESLIGTFGDSMNTFEGSAQVAGKLNAVLGTDMFSSTELLMATEAERMQIMKERMAMSGVDFANLSKYQQIALANAAGISDVNEAAKIFGNTQSEVGMQIGSLTMTTAELEERSQKARSVQDKLKFAIQSFAVALEPVVGLLAKAGNGLVSFTEFMAKGAETTKGKWTKALIMSGIFIVGAILIYRKFRKTKDKLTDATEKETEATEGLTGALKEKLKVQALSVIANNLEARAIDKVTVALRRRGAAGRVAGGMGGFGRMPGGGVMTPTGVRAAGTATRAATPAAARTAARAAAPAAARTAGRAGLQAAGGFAAGGLGLGARTGARRAGVKLGASALKSGLKKIPFLGALMGIGFGAQRAMRGDLLGAGMEVVSGVASILPGAGTAASLGIDAALLARDMGGASAPSAPASAAAGGITTQEGLVNVHPQEAIVPLDQLMSKFDQLISAVGSPAGGSGEMVVKVMLNERELGEAVVPLIDRRVLGEV